MNDAFKRWSKGAPLILEGSKLPANGPFVVKAYHGSFADIVEFWTDGPEHEPDEEDLGRIPAGDPNVYLGAHFALEPHVAGQFAGHEHHASWMKVALPRGMGSVYPVYLRLENPQRMTEQEMSDLIWEQPLHGYPLQVLEEAIQNETEDEHIGEAPDEEQMQKEIDEVWRQYEMSPLVRRKWNATVAQYMAEEREEVHEPLGASAKAVLRAQGYDSIIYPNNVEGGTSVIVFSPTQIKSASGNRGTFDPEDPDIRRNGLKWDPEYGQLPSYAREYPKSRIQVSQIASPFINPIKDERVEELQALEEAGYTLPPIIVNGPFEVEEEDYPEEKYPFLDGHYPEVGEEVWFVHDGHHRVMVALQRGQKKIDVVVIQHPRSNGAAVHTRLSEEGQRYLRDRYRLRRQRAAERSLPEEMPRIEAVMQNPAFQAWFEGSEVTDPEGRPLLVYHGTMSDFEVFRPHYRRSEQMGFGMHFTSDNGMASDYAGGEAARQPRGGAPRLLEGFLQVRSPLNAEWVGPKGTPEHALARALYPKIDTIRTAYLHKQANGLVVERIGISMSWALSEALAGKGGGKRVERILREAGYDGVRYTAVITTISKPTRWVRCWIALDPRQFKSIDNVGTFSAEDPRFRHNPSRRGPR